VSIATGKPNYKPSCKTLHFLIVFELYYKIQEDYLPPIKFDKFKGMSFHILENDFHMDEKSSPINDIVSKGSKCLKLFPFQLIGFGMARLLDNIYTCHLT
jgi:hypothetical protein